MDYCKCGHPKNQHDKQAGCWGRRGEEVGNPRPCECMKYRYDKFVTNLKREQTQ